LLGWWTGDTVSGTALDIAQAASGTLSGGVVSAPGKTGQALAFDGSTGVVRVAGASLPPLSDGFTISAWVRPECLLGTSRILSWGQAGVGGFGFGQLNGNLLFTTYGIKDYVTAATCLQVGEWAHVVVVFGAGHTAHFYINGTLVESVAGPAAARLAAGDLFL